jgi:cyclopropane-fatty-acyl-phospholipid synthase
MRQRLARRIAQWAFARIHSGRLTVVDGDERRVYGSGAPAATLEILDPRAWRMLLRGSRGMADAYLDGWWASPDLTALIRVAARNMHGLDRLRRRVALLRAPFLHLGNLARIGTRRRSRRHVAAHYDLGNDMFELMLDPTLMYSCAVFDRPGMTLEEASLAKLERVCEKLALGHDDHVLEIGTGWGGFAIHAAVTRGCRVTTTTLSREQRDVALERVRAAGVEDRVTVLLEDYRDLTGSYDKLVSIEMIEAVGWRHFGTFFDRCSRLLRPDGLMLLQAITIDDRAYEVEKHGGSFIKDLVFPGGNLPSVEVMTRCIARRTDMQAVGLEDLTPHYAETLRRWRTNFGRARARLGELGYDERFRRLWTLYLTYCEAGFAERRIGNVQMVLAKPAWGLGHHAALCADSAASRDPLAEAIS